MIAPQTALVRPRVVSPISGEILPLVEVAAEQLAAGSRIVQIFGGPGSGKSTALAHLAAVLPPASDLVFLDDPSVSNVATHASRLRVICAGRQRYPEIGPVIVPLALAPWTDDDLIEYLRAVAPDRCANVMQRWAALADRQDLAGNPALVRAVADELLADDVLISLRVALQRIIADCLRDPEERRIAALFCLAILLRDEPNQKRYLDLIARLPEDLQRLRWLRHPLVQRLLAGEHTAGLLLRGAPCPFLAPLLPRPLVRELGWLAARDSLLADRLRAVYDGPQIVCHPQAASILFAADRTWRPESGRRAWLVGGSFAGAAWAGIQLPKTKQGASDLSAANLTGADLRQAVLDGVDLRKAHLTGACLDKASLTGALAGEANLAGAHLIAAVAQRILLHRANLKGAILDDASLPGAELSQADLTGARFRKSDLTGAILLGCKIADADFTGANLSGCYLRELTLREAILDGATFHDADLTHCDLEGVRLEAPDFSEAALADALLTGSVLPGANFQRANLRGAGLADIHWEQADLRDADLRGATFHMGSTRSGLVGSPYPGHGSKTGFYTDDCHDQDYKLPEEIRKANLCGADLRGARLDGVDFYLVDLRGALLDDDALEQVVRTGGILYDRCA
jgi:uncharacterized protein YjbI with pentapeptide repeats/energy-coupling factor transporter ATP-binding protein EcfA2